ncbi:Protein CBG03045 [Caenorhabditis briggsae]|uniref:Protein CBG03045 n=1 Tax=Caenorhabditis briggsae TaxID=6238 RepID=A8WSX4_CAEBR|nr:Protein CBG03045 [Caenorhabditis briggsae]CAP23583.2 Protein CBG03045 [Caenorhabditis briggsae]
MRFLLLLFVPALVHGFSSSFNYGCQNGKCTFQLVVPKEVAQYINENTLSSEISQITSDIGKLNDTITHFNDSEATNFTTLFTHNCSIVDGAAQSLNTSVNAALQNSTGNLNKQF